MALTTFTPNTVISPTTVNSNFVGIANGSEIGTGAITIGKLASGAVGQYSFEIPIYSEKDYFKWPEFGTRFARVISAYGWHARQAPGDGVPGNWISWDVYLCAGTWTITAIVAKDYDRGKIHFLINGTDVGNVDTYNSSNQAMVRETVTGVSVATTGKKTLKAIVSSKNASSSNYLIQLCYLAMTRTGS